MNTKPIAGVRAGFSLLAGFAGDPLGPARAFRRKTQPERAPKPSRTVMNLRERNTRQMKLAAHLAARLRITKLEALLLIAAPFAAKHPHVQR